jgi:hypothetical protein
MKGGGSSFLSSDFDLFFHFYRIFSDKEAKLQNQQKTKEIISILKSSKRHHSIGGSKSKTYFRRILEVRW